MNPRITRIKFHADGRLVVGYQLPNRKDPDVLDDAAITSADTPSPTFAAALLELQPFLLEHAGLPSGTRLVITRMQIRWLGASSVRRLVRREAVGVDQAITVLRDPLSFGCSGHAMLLDVSVELAAHVAQRSLPDEVVLVFAPYRLSCILRFAGCGAAADVAFALKRVLDPCHRSGSGNWVWVWPSRRRPAAFFPTRWA